MTQSEKNEKMEQLLASKEEAKKEVDAANEKIAELNRQIEELGNAAVDAEPVETLVDTPVENTDAEPVSEPVEAPAYSEAEREEAKTLIEKIKEKFNLE